MNWGGGGVIELGNMPSHIRVQHILLYTQFLIVLFQTHQQSQQESIPVDSVNWLWHKGYSKSRNQLFWSWLSITRQTYSQAIQCHILKTSCISLINYSRSVIQLGSSPVCLRTSAGQIICSVLFKIMFLQIQQQQRKSAHKQMTNV